MRDFLLLCGGGLALTACSDNFYEEIDKENRDYESQYGTSSFNNDSVGHAHEETGDSGLIWAAASFQFLWLNSSLSLSIEN